MGNTREPPAGLSASLGSWTIDAGSRDSYINIAADGTAHFNASETPISYPLRQRFDHIRAFVPLAAMSAATMWALACDEAWMGKHSQLGPIDPQLLRSGGQYPARAILEPFERAVSECSNDPKRLIASSPILQQSGPSLLDQCTKAERQAKRLVRDWLRRWMMAGRVDRIERSRRVADYFADYPHHQSHGLGIDREQAAAKGVENHLGRAFVKISLQNTFTIPLQLGPTPFPVPIPIGPQNPGPPQP